MFVEEVFYEENEEDEGRSYRRRDKENKEDKEDERYRRNGRNRSAFRDNGSDDYDLGNDGDHDNYNY